MFSADQFRKEVDQLRHEADPQVSFRAEAGRPPEPAEAPASIPASTPAPMYDALASANNDPLSIALIGPNDQLRNAAGLVIAGCQSCNIREFSSYPPGLDDVPRLLEQNYDVVVIDLDSDPEYALELLESVSARGAATVMVYSTNSDPELLMRCMRAGAREFLTVPFSHSMLNEALVRATARRPAVRPQKKEGGKLMVFLGAKGGSGVTMLACNFAVSLARETSQSTLLIDLDLPLGDAALNLGISAEFSTIDALKDWRRLDQNLLASMLVKHNSGVSVLAAPGKFPDYQPEKEAIDRLVQVARASFDNVVIDAGSRLDLTGTGVFREAFASYLVTQAGIPELRNSNRLIGEFFPDGGPRLEIVVNRYEPKQMGVTDEHIAKALTRPVQWKIPNDYGAVRKMQNTATPLALGDSSLARHICEMAKSVTPKPEEEPAKKKRFGIF